MEHESVGGAPSAEVVRGIVCLRTGSGVPTETLNADPWRNEIMMPASIFASRQKHSVSRDLGAWRRTGAQGWRSADRDETRSAPLGSAAPLVGHDFSRIRVHPAHQEGVVQTTTIPFRAVIRAAGGDTSEWSKTTHDNPSEEAPVQRQPEPPSPSQGSARQEAKASPPVERDENTLYIAQMGGPPAMKDTNGVADTVKAAFAYTHTTTRGGVVKADDFGTTSGSLKHFSNVSITPGTGKFTVTADLKQEVVWDTRAIKGPDNQVNIMSVTDAALTRANYPHVVTDLTPDMTDLKGRPPRTKFWSKDLTEEHEKYHVKDFVDIAKTGATGAQTWLAGQNAARKEDVPALLDTAWSNQIFNVWDKFTDPPAVEERAYSHGAPSYKARADAIKAKGDKGAVGGYPP
jgi:hypothetical protein